MTQLTRKNILLPTGRYVQGNVYEGKTHDDKGELLVYKTGKNKGQPRVEWYFAVAIAKNPGLNWWDEPWGQEIVRVANACFPGGQTTRRDFSWKIKDGDSTEPNANMKRNCDREGWPGHWIVGVNSGFLPRVVNQDGAGPWGGPGDLKLGYFIQVYIDVDGNDRTDSPGVYINCGFVSYQAYGPEIYVGPDASAVGFGKGALPPGASLAPVGGLSPAAATHAAGPGLPPAAGPGATHAAGPGLPPAAGPGATPQPAPAPAPVAAPVRQMTAKAGAFTYDQYMAAGGWTDEMLIAQGLMVMTVPAVAPANPTPATTATATGPASALPPAVVAGPGSASGTISPSSVVPNPAFVAGPGATPAGPGAPVRVRQMTAKAGAFTYDQYMAAGGWTDEMLVAQGLMLP